MFINADWPSVSAQSISNLSITLHEAGAAAEPSIGDTLSPASPLPEGTSFQELGKVLQAFGQLPAAMRGTQEITAYRQAAPAVVLLKTKEGSGSGAVLQNGLVLSNKARR